MPRTLSAESKKTKDSLIDPGERRKPAEIVLTRRRADALSA
jgi:hypothetical protein